MCLLSLATRQGHSLQIAILEPVINFIPLESKKYPSAPLSLTMGGWETRGKSAIPAM
jgi:hypothetical protein